VFGALMTARPMMVPPGGRRSGGVPDPGGGVDVVSIGVESGALMMLELEFVRVVVVFVAAAGIFV